MWAWPLPQRWVRYVLAALMVPIAILTNAIRIMGAGLLARHFAPAAAEGFLQESSGWAIFPAALICGQQSDEGRGIACEEKLFRD